MRGGSGAAREEAHSELHGELDIVPAATCLKAWCTTQAHHLPWQPLTHSTRRLLAPKSTPAAKALRRLRLPLFYDNTAWVVPAGALTHLMITIPYWTR